MEKHVAHVAVITSGAGLPGAARFLCFACPALAMSATLSRGCFRRRTAVCVVSGQSIGGKQSHCVPGNVKQKSKIQDFASICSSSDGETLVVGGNPQLPLSPRPSYIGTPLLWIGVGVGLSAAFSMVATKLKRNAIMQAFRAVMNQAATQDGHSNSTAFDPGSSIPLSKVSPSTPIGSSIAEPDSSWPFPIIAAGTAESEINEKEEVAIPLNAADTAGIETNESKEVAFLLNVADDTAETQTDEVATGNSSSQNSD